MSGGSGSASNEGVPLGVNFSPVNVNAPEPCRKVARAVIPSGVPSSSGRAISRFSFCKLLSRWFVYRGHVLMMCSRVCRFSPHAQATPSPGQNCLRNSPVYAWPVRHWTRRPNTSRWSLSSTKCLVGFRDGGILLEIAKRPVFGDLCQSRAHAV